MGNKFNINKYNKDKGKSYKFCQERKTMEDDNNVQHKKIVKDIDNTIDALFKGFNNELIEKSKTCKKLDMLDCCTSKQHNRTLPECKVCSGNV
ncbi:MAG: hypothetical protein KAR20_03075 [Candidatus Heimdallarchaeota archaeon]|nr:hypothetical protein [Candidatus Heimdallarchaeota archaeon]